MKILGASSNKTIVLTYFISGKEAVIFRDSSAVS